MNAQNFGGPTMGPALVQITTSVPSLAAEKKKNVVRKERGPLAKQHKNDVGLLFPKYNTFDSCGVKSKNSNSDLHQGCSFQVDYCHAKHVCYRTKSRFCGN